MDFFLWEPNEQTPIRERYEFLTDIQESYNGSETRYCLRKSPRVFLTYEVAATHLEAQKMNNFIRRNQGKVVKIPYWLGGIKRLTSSASQPVFTETGLRPTSLGFLNGAENCIFYLGQHKYDIRQVVSSTLTDLSTTAPTITDFPIGSMIYPLRQVFCPASMTITNKTDQFVMMQISFQMVESINHPTIDQPTQWYDKDVFLKQPNRVNDRTEEVSRILLELDYLTGRKSYYDQANQPFSNLNHEHYFPSRLDKHAFLGWMSKMKGQQGSFFVPTWQQDILFSNWNTPIAPSSMVFHSNDMHLDANIYPQDIIFLGSWDFKEDINELRMRRIANIEILPDDKYTRLTPVDDTSLNNITNFTRKISFLPVARLASDTIEFVHLSKEVSTTNLSIKTLRRLDE